MKLIKKLGLTFLYVYGFFRKDKFYYFLRDKCRYDGNNLCKNRLNRKCLGTLKIVGINANNDDKFMWECDLCGGRTEYDLL